MSRLKQERAGRLLQDYYIVGSSIEPPSPLWHRRHRRWVQPDTRLVSAFSLFRFSWSVDLVIVTVEGDEFDVQVETYSTKEPMRHDEVVEEFIQAHREMTRGRDNIAAVSWVLRLDRRAPSAEVLAELTGII